MKNVIIACLSLSTLIFAGTTFSRAQSERNFELATFHLGCSYAVTRMVPALANDDWVEETCWRLTEEHRHAMIEGVEGEAK